MDTATPERKLWDARVKRDRSRHPREHADAVHDFLRKVAPDRWPADALQASAEELEAAHREYLDTLGRVSGAGKYPER